MFLINLSPHFESRAVKREVTLEEQLSIFLYTCVTGLMVQHVGERFQQVNNTIAKYVKLECSELFAHLFCCRYFKEMLVIFSSPPFYNKFVQMPNVNASANPGPSVAVCCSAAQGLQ